MDKRIILAVAGAGKTYTICQRIHKNSKNLILAYTNENIHNIKRELISRFGKIPELTNVMTFDSFIYRYILCPYEPTILSSFGEDNFTRKGITTRKPPQPSLLRDGKRVMNRRYYKKDRLQHYEINGFYYCENLAELIMLVNSRKTELINRVSMAINMFYDNVYIDEFQDFREFYYDLIVELSKKINCITLVGDFYQHSVSGQNNSGKPFKKGKKEVNYDEFVENLQKQKFHVDNTTLVSSRRCPKSICDYVKIKLKIDINANNKNHGIVRWIQEEEIEAILMDDTVIKLVWNGADKCKFKALNWSYSKGDTFNHVCVILTNKFDDLDKDDFDCVNIPQITRNKLYVALTRTKGNLFLVKKNVFDTVKSKYIDLSE